MDYIVYAGIVYLCMGGCLYGAAMQNRKLDGTRMPRYIWLSLPLWPIIFIVGKRRTK